ncbi:phage holin family protein, partial [Pseudomonas aeruginosa]|uniref:phage holin family protein n=1 Tax=Pseudomonas aeruginosa TaxID=287 RepID=UPI0027E3C0AF
MGNEPQTLTEMPLWVLILLAALGGVSGEMWRADKAGLCLLYTSPSPRDIS